MYKQVIVVRKDLKLGKGKLAAQVAHASLQAYVAASPQAKRKWEEEGSKKVVVKASSKKELLAIFQKAKKLFPVSLIKDAGLTQIPRGEVTAVGIGPAKAKEIDVITGRLKLL